MNADDWTALAAYLRHESLAAYLRHEAEDPTSRLLQSLSHVATRMAQRQLAPVSRAIQRNNPCQPNSPPSPPSSEPSE